MEATLGRMLAVAAARFGDKSAVVAPDRTLTFAELERLSVRLAGVLRSRGVVPGDRVTLWVENGWRWMVAYYAILKIGAVVNPCNILLTAEEVGFIVADCGAKLVIAAYDKAEKLPSYIGAPVVTDQPRAGFAHSLDAWIESGGNDSLAERCADLWADPASPCTIGYTSGTTGHPKGAVLRHSSIVLNTAMTSLMHGRTSLDRIVSALPCTHVYGNVVMNSAALCGLTLVLLPRFDERLVLESIERYRATMLEGVPTMFMRLLNFPDLDAFELDSLRVCTVGGQTMPISKMQEVERRFGCPLLELWGMTEIGGLGTTHPHNGPHRLGSIGIPLPLTQTCVVAMDDADQVLPRGEVGELMIRGPLLMDGYHGNAAATRATIRPDGWMHTGDLVRADDDGYLFVVGRAKEVIISGGYNVYPAEVERVVAQHPAVAMVAVAAMHDELKGQVPRAFIVPKVGRTCTAQEIIEHCRPHLASYKLPRDITLLDDLPKTSTGKILRRVLSDSRF